MVPHVSISENVDASNRYWCGFYAVDEQCSHTMLKHLWHPKYLSFGISQFKLTLFTDLYGDVMRNYFCYKHKVYFGTCESILKQQHWVLLIYLKMTNIFERKLELLTKP